MDTQDYSLLSQLRPKYFPLVEDVGGFFLDEQTAFVWKYIEEGCEWILISVNHDSWISVENHLPPKEDKESISINALVRSVGNNSSIYDIAYYDYSTTNWYLEHSGAKWPFEVTHFKLIFDPVTKELLQ